MKKEKDKENIKIENEAKAKNIRCIKKALDVLKNGEPLQYMVNVISKRHYGDDMIKKALLLSYPSILAKSVGHRYLIGPSGGGKTDICDEVGMILPEGVYESFAGSSSKSKIYALMENAEVLKNKVFYYDDTKTTDEEFRRLIRIIKDLKLGKTRYYETVINLKSIKILIEGNCAVWESSVELPKDKQDYSRALTCKVNESKKHRRKVEKKIKELEGTNSYHHTPQEYAVCQAINHMLSEQNIPGVVIPFYARIAGIRSGRSTKIFMSLIKANAVLYCMNVKKPRKRDKNGRIIATVEDFEVAKEIFLAFTRKKIMTEQESMVWEELPDYVHCAASAIDINTIERLLGVSYQRASEVIRKLASNGFASHINDPNNYRRKLWYKLEIKEKGVWLLEEGEEEPMENDKVSGGEVTRLPIKPVEKTELERDESIEW